MDDAVDENVVIQIKNGPIDFQVREPVSSIFSHLTHARPVLEIQVTQEYLGQQCHLAYLGPMYKEIIGFDFAINNETSPLSAILNGQEFNRRPGGYAAVVNVGLDETWLGSHLAMSNLYAYGHLAWDPSSCPEELIRAWTRLTFGHDEDVIETISTMSMTSWPAYENYTAPLGLLSMIDSTSHFGPDPASRVHSSIPTRAYPRSIGIDRTVRNGSAYAGQYPQRVAEMYENVETTPEELLLFFHHVPYSHQLSSGSTVIQYLYDAHYAGSQTAHDYIGMWISLKDKIDRERYEHILYRLEFQAGHSLVWRDAINNFFRSLTGIPDEAGRVGNHTWRIEAEDMELDGYTIQDVHPIVSASRGRAIVTASNTTIGTATATLDFPTNEYDLAINYFDLASGNSTWEVFINGESVSQWSGDAESKLGYAPARSINGVSATRVTIRNITVSGGDVIRIEGTPSGEELAPLDYISLLPLCVVD
ncbi:glycoside hydrolase superfamily [Stachybotrys elegans]|uniref:Glycoside hydrolase superfamily n=1 Tax=Stachybotrys elegans TaxID=80388 RepID=A0A8K0SIR8_9HYPO|nr:glycoside hydrolase superfamily [Stachybotrys elegans]